jgi:NADPH-dependent 2,4-dienoyl-CoA reductase/sulfur reductase-like enzyme
MSDPVVIIGAGPAGLACAAELASAGRETVLIDDNPAVGGQYFRQLPPSYRTASGARLLRDKARFDRLAAKLQVPAVRHLGSTVAWGAPDSRTVAYSGIHGSGRLGASAVVLAGGAQERSFPFTGWTLPGVISAGGCLNLAKAHGLVPSGRVIIAGNGPLVLVAAATMIAAGANVTAVIEAQPDRKLASVGLAGLVAAPDIMAKAIGYRARILRSRTPFKTGWMVCEARGADVLREVAIAPVDADGKPVLEQKRWMSADILVVGYGLLSGSEPARVFGCGMEMNPALSGLVPLRSPSLETSVAGVYAIGDGAGIGGVEVALLEGHIAALSILGAPVPPALARRYHSLDRYRRKLNVAYMTSRPLVAATEQTIICRCEEISLGRLLSDPNSGRESLGALKTSSRLGMGRCQGRNCLPVASSVLGLDLQDGSTYPRARPPLRPVFLGGLAADADAGPAREPDEIDLSNAREAQ